MGRGGKPAAWCGYERGPRSRIGIHPLTSSTSMKRTTIIVVSMLGLFAASCSGASETTAAQDADDRPELSTTTGTSTTTTSTSTTTIATTAPAADLGPLEAMLALVPNTREYGKYVVINDYRAAIAALGQEPPSGDDTEAVREFLSALTTQTSPPILVLPVGFGDRAFEIEAWKEQFGFSFLDVDRDVLAGQPPDELFAVQGAFAPGAIDSAVKADPVWSDDLTEAEHDGEPYFLWSDPMVSAFDKASGPRPLGRGGALAVVGDETVFRSVNPEVVTNALDGVAGTSTTLADNKAFASIARSLETHSVHSALLSNEPVLVNPLYVFGGLSGAQPTVEEMEERLNAIPKLPLYLAFGVGQALDDDTGGLLVVSFAMLDPASAEAMLDAFTVIVEQGESFQTNSPWSERLVIKETQAEGNIATIVMETENPRIGFNAFLTRDSLFVTG